ncbi:hypothetical protein ACLKA7_005289 [Drosophila subpalustris]
MQREIQCLKCLRFSHKRADCPSQNYICFHCVGPHDAFSCSKDPLESAVCVNCRGNHVATYLAYPARERARIKREMDEFAASPRRILRLVGIPTQAGYVGGLLVDEELRGELSQLVAYIERVERATRLTRLPAVATAAPPEAAHPPGQG